MSAMKNMFPEIFHTALLAAMVIMVEAAAASPSYAAPQNLQDNRIVSYVNGQKFNFRILDGYRLELLPGDYGEELVIPAGVEHEGNIYTVTCIGQEALTGSSLQRVIVPHTVSVLDYPFGTSLTEQAPIDSIKFYGRPSHIRGVLPYDALKYVKEKKPGLEAGDPWGGGGFTVDSAAPLYNMLAVRDNETGLLGITSYDSVMLPFEYEDYDNIYVSYEDGYMIHGVVLKKDGKWGLVDLNGKILLPFRYESPEMIGDRDQIGKKMYRATLKVYGKKAWSESFALMRRRCDAQIPYLMYLAGGYGWKTDEEKSIEESWNRMFKVAGYDRQRDKGSLELCFDSLMAAGAAAEAKVLYKGYGRDFGYDAGMEDRLADAGVLDYTGYTATSVAWENGEYTGRVDEFGRPHGQAKYIKDDNVSDMLWLIITGGSSVQTYNHDIFTGMWIRGKMYGEGVMTRYEICDDPAGADTVRLFTCTGYLIDGKPAGTVLMEYAEDAGFFPAREMRLARYVGTVSDWKPDGYGTGHYYTGETYTGGWKDGKLSGKGRYTFTDGQFYDGEFENDDFISGTALVYFEDGARYEGGIRDYLLHGHGKYRIADGTVYEGEFRDNKLRGQFTVTYPSGETETKVFGEAGYITVNGKTFLEEVVPKEGGVRTYSVSTDWIEYLIDNLPGWIEVVSNDAESFTLRFYPNNTSAIRDQNIYVKAGGKYMRIWIEQERGK